MPVCNISDGRSEGLKFNVNIMAIFEACWHDNGVSGATQFPDEDVDPFYGLYFGIEETTIELAIKYANQQWPDVPMCLYLYDPNCKNFWDIHGLVVDEETGQIVEIARRRQET